MSTRGKYIVIEGTDGTGKTTQAKLLVETLNNQNVDTRYVHEPGETAIGLELEKLIKNRQLERSSLTNLLLFTANRIELYLQVIEPALASGQTIVADRNWVSSIAYQGVAGGLGIEKVQEVTRQWLPQEYIYPDFTALLHTPDNQRKKMLNVRSTSTDDYFETQPDEFQQKIREGYKIAQQIVSKQNGKSAYVTAEGSINEVHSRIINVFKDMNFLT